MKKLLLLLIFIFIVLVSFAETYTVERVINCKTLKFSNDEEIFFIGIECSEGEMGREATEFVKNLIEGKEVRLEFDVEKKDKYGRTLAYVWEDRPMAFYYVNPCCYESNLDKGVDSFLINAIIINDGYASPMTIPPNVKHAELFKKLYEEAREAKRGLWKEQDKLKLSDYKALAKKCEEKSSVGCCMDSVKVMETGQYLLDTGLTFKETACPKGYQPNMLKCVDSYRWCMPSK